MPRWGVFRVTGAAFCPDDSGVARYALPSVIRGGDVTKARFSSVGMFVVGVAIVLLGGVGVGVVLTSRDASEVEGAPDPALVDVLSAIGDAQSYRFTSVGEASFPDIDESASDAASRSAESGEWTPDRWRMLVEKDNSVVETVLEGNIGYTRVADDVAALRAERWTKHEDAIVPLEERLRPDDLNEVLLPEFDDDEEVRDMIVLSLAETVYLHADEGSIQTDSIWTTDPTIGDPTGCLDAISHMTETRVVERAGGVTRLAGVLPPPSGLLPESGEVFPAGQVELIVLPSGLPSTLRFTVALGADSSSIEIHFTDWNEPLEIDVPPSEGIDAHPRVDEEGLRSARVPLVGQPTCPPTGSSRSTRRMRSSTSASSKPVVTLWA
jgi:hypothetical protein